MCEKIKTALLVFTVKKPRIFVVWFFAKLNNLRMWFYWLTKPIFGPFFLFVCKNLRVFYCCTCSAKWITIILHQLLESNSQLQAIFYNDSRVAQWKRAGPITQRSVDRNYALLVTFFFSVHMMCLIQRGRDMAPRSVQVPLAQRIARWTSNPKVLGSIPRWDGSF